jgi:hypothetical protein
MSNLKSGGVGGGVGGAPRFYKNRDFVLSAAGINKCMKNILPYFKILTAVNKKLLSG